MPLSPLFLGPDNNNPTSSRSGLSPPSHLGLLTSEQFVDETILNLKTVVNLFGQKWKSDPENVDIEICETPKNTTEKEIADDTSAKCRRYF